MSTSPDPFLDQLMEDLCIEPEQLRKALESEYLQRDDLEPEVKDLMIEYHLGEYHERESKAWENAIRILEKSPERIVKDLCELVDYFLEAKSNKAEMLLYCICKYTTSQPHLVPFDWLERWIGSPEQLKDRGFLYVAIMVSRVQPDLIVDEQCFAPILKLSESMGLESCELWFNVGISYPEVLLKLAEIWFDRVGWNTKFGNCLARAFTEVAHIRKEQIGSMIEVLGKVEFKEEPLEPNLIRLTFEPSPSDMIAELEKIRLG